MSEATRSTKRGVRLKDVAQVAGVSVATASKAINGRQDVRPATRRRVLEAAERLDFTPNALAQNLHSGSTGTVGLITHDLEGRFSIPILMGAEDAFGAGKMSIFLCDAREDEIRQAHHLNSLLARRVDGIIIVGSRTDPHPPVRPEVEVPVVYVYAPSDRDEDLSFVPDNVGAGRQVTEHLLSLGRRHIAHIAGDVTYAATTDRVRGITATLAESGLELLGGRASYGSWSESWGRAAARSVVEAWPKVDAIVAGSDQIARGVLDGLRDLGRTVPQDVAVASFDNWQILATGARPQLTSVDMNFKALGRRAARAIFEAIDGNRSQGVHTEPCQLVVRGSTVAE
ncbi:MAG TPA: LacI family DNA-binding transcriptional regulator [Ruania sp.]|nr:LacI family DNA-binding transcriptional regulator [Ruania sp.]